MVKKFTEILKETTTTAAVPPVQGGAVPTSVVNMWKRNLDYDKEMKKKFSYYDVVFKTKNLPKGHKGHLSRRHNELNTEIKKHGLDVADTLAKLYKLHPPKYF